MKKGRRFLAWKELGLPRGCAQEPSLLGWVLSLSEATHRGPGTSRKNPRHQPHPRRAAACRHSRSKTQGVKWSEPVHARQGRHIPAPPPLWSTPAGPGQSWTVKDAEGTATGWQDGPHTLHPVRHQVSLRRYPASSFLEGSFPIKYPGHGMENSRTLSSCSRIAGAMEGQLWRGGPGRPETERETRWGGPCLPALHPGQQPQPQPSPTSLLSSWMWSVPFSLSRGPPCLTTSSVATLTKASSTLLESLADVSMAHRMS